MQRLLRQLRLYGLLIASLGIATATSLAQPAPDSNTNALFQNVFSQRKARTASKISVPLKFDQNELGLVEVDPSSSPIHISGKVLGSLLKAHLKAEVIEQLAQDPKWLWVSLEELKKLGIHAQYSPERISLEVTVDLPLRLIKTLMIDQRRSQVMASTLPIVNPAKYSLIWNTRLVQTWQRDAQSSLTKGQLFNDWAARAGDWLGELGGSITMQGGSEFNRTHTRLVRDWTAQSTRLTLGDTVSGERGALSAQVIGGVRLSKQFSINPAFNTLSLPTDKVSLNTGGAVDISVNGYLVRTLRLDPGVYNLKDIYAFQGANDVSIRIVEAGGRTTVRRFDYFFDASLLAKGVHEWDLAVGVPSRAAPLGRHYEGGTSVSSFWWRTGLRNNVTAGVGMQNLNGLGQRASLSQIEGLWMTPWGAWSSWLARSTHETSPVTPSASQGVAQMLQWRAQSARQPGSQWSASFAVQAMRASHGYSALDNTAVTASTNDLGLRANLAWSSDWSASAAASRRLSDDPTRQSRTLTLGLRHRISKTWSAEGTAGQLHNTAGAQPFINVALRYSPVDTETASSQTYISQSYQSTDRRWQTDAETKGNTTVFDAEAPWRLGASQRHSDAGSEYTLRSRIQTSRGESTWSTIQSKDALLGNAVYHGWTLASAVVATATGIRISSPVYDSAIVFSPSAGFESYKILVDPQYDRAAAASDRWGAPVSTDIFAYNQREMQLDLENLPPGRSLGMDRFILSPSYRSVLDVSVGSQANTQVSGALTNPAGAPLALQTLRIMRTDAAEPKGLTSLSLSPIEVFTNRKGTFLSPALPAGRYQLIHLQQNDIVIGQFVVNPAQSGIHALGTFIIKE